MNYFLFSPIGATDPIRENRDGAMIHICRKYKPKKIILYMSKEMLEHHKQDNRYCFSIEKLKKESGFEDWDPEIILSEHPELVEVQKMDNFILEFKKEIEPLKSQCENGDKIILNVSSGTPAMKYTLQLLSTQDEKLFLPVQVDTPKKACNLKEKSNLYSEPELEWFCNKDNDPTEFADRCNISQNNNLFVYLLKEKIKELINNYDYAGAFTIAKSIETEFGQEFIVLLDAAKQRLALNYVTANNIFKKYGYKMLVNETGDIAKLYEYILYLNIKIKTDNYIEFTRGISPIFEDLLFYKVKDKMNSYINTKPDKTSRWNAVELEKSEFADFDFVKNRNKRYNEMYIKSEDLIEIIEKCSPSDRELGTIYAIRDFEVNTRNFVAHEIKPLRNEEKKNCERILDMIINLAVQVKLLKADNVKNFLNGYDNMNAFLLKKGELTI